MVTYKAFKMTVKVRAIFGPPLRVVKPLFSIKTASVWPGRSCRFTTWPVLYTLKAA